MAYMHSLIFLPLEQQPKVKTDHKSYISILQISTLLLYTVVMIPGK